MALCTHFILMFRQKQVLFLCLLGMMALCTEAGSVPLPFWHDGSLYRSRFCFFAFLTSWLFVQKQVMFLCLLGMTALWTEAGSVSLPSWHDGSLYSLHSYVQTEADSVPLPSWHDGSLYISRFCLFAFLA